MPNRTIKTIIIIRMLHSIPPLSRVRVRPQLPLTTDLRPPPPHPTTTTHHPPHHPPHPRHIPLLAKPILQFLVCLRAHPFHLLWNKRPTIYFKHIFTFFCIHTSCRRRHILHHVFCVSTNIGRIKLVLPIFLLYPFSFLNKMNSFTCFRHFFILFNISCRLFSYFEFFYIKKPKYGKNVKKYLMSTLFIKCESAFVVVREQCFFALRIW